jgi:hypothetical protein
MNLLLAEHDYQVEDFISRGLDAKSEWIALGPSAMWTLDKKGIPYHTAEDFCRQEDIETLCVENHRRIEWLCNQLDENMLSDNPDLQEKGIHPCFFHIMPITILFDGLLRRIFQLKAILWNYPSYSVWVHKEPSQKPSIFGLTFSNEDTLWGNLLSLEGWGQNIHILNSDHPKMSKKASPLAAVRACLLKNTEISIQKHIRLYTGLKALREKNLNAIIGTIRSKNKGTLLIHNSPYEWSWVIPSLRAKGWRALLFKDKCLYDYSDVSSCENSINKTTPLEDDSEIRRLFEYDNINFFNILRSRFQWLTGNLLTACREVDSSVTKIVRDYNVKALLTATNPSGISHVVHQTARSLGIPVIRYQHGFVCSHNGLMQLNEHSDLMTSDVFLTFGRGVDASYQEFTDKYPAKVISVGSAKIDNIRGIRMPENPKVKNKRNNHPTRILYATSAYFGNLWYCGFSPAFSDCRFMKEQLRIIEHLCKLKETIGADLDITIKLDSGSWSQNQPWRGEFESKKGIRIIKNTPSFIDLLSISDIVVLDMPTTVLLEAVSTNLPVFVLMRHWAYPAQALQMLTRRAVATSNLQYLMHALQKYLVCGAYPAHIKNNDFLRAYGNFRDDGKSAARAIKVIEELLKKKPYLRTDHKRPSRKSRIGIGDKHGTAFLRERVAQHFTSNH